MGWLLVIGTILLGLAVLAAFTWVLLFVVNVARVRWRDGHPGDDDRSGPPRAPTGRRRAPARGDRGETAAQQRFRRWRDSGESAAAGRERW